MARRFSWWCAVVCGLVVSGCSYTVAPPAPVKPATPAAVAKPASAPAGAYCDVPSLARAKQAKPEPPAIELSQPELTLAPGDAGWQLLARRGVGTPREDLTPRLAWQVEPSGVV